MSKDNSASVSIGPGFLGCLAILFITLKLCGVIDWSWVWVLAPLWGPVAFVFGVFGLVLAVAALWGVCFLVAMGVAKVEIVIVKMPDHIRDMAVMGLGSYLPLSDALEELGLLGWAEHIRYHAREGHSCLYVLIDGTFTQRPDDVELLAYARKTGHLL